jgi:hypothetical protein
LLASSKTTSSSRRRRGRSDYLPSKEENYCWGDPVVNDSSTNIQNTKTIILTARSKKAKIPKEETTKPTSVQEAIENPMSTEEMYSQLGPIGKVVAGCVEITVSTLMEYCTGFFGGYVLGSITDVPSFVFKNVNEGQRLPFFQELSQRYGRMHAKSFRWAKTWGGISATFGGCRVATKVLRGGKEDEWNTVFSSAAAGAFFARNGKCCCSGIYSYFKGINCFTWSDLSFLFFVF